MRLGFLVLLLAGLWMLLFGRFDGLTFFAGLLAGAIAVGLSQSLFHNGRSQPSSRADQLGTVGLGLRVWSIIRLGWLYAYELIACNLMMVRDVLRLSPPLAPAIFALEVPGLGPAGTTILANLITLTPGSLVLDFEESTETLYIHTIYAQNVESMKRDYRRFARQIFRVIGREPSGPVLEVSR